MRDDSLPGLTTDVYFGDAERELPDWRKELQDEDGDSDVLSNEERAAIVGMIGFDPSSMPRGRLSLPQRKDATVNETDKGIGDTVQSAGKWLAQRWEKLEARYGRKQALVMAAGMLATFPLPGNIAAIVGIAEAIRGIHGYFARELSLQEIKAITGHGVHKPVNRLKNLNKRQ